MLHFYFYNPINPGEDVQMRDAKGLKACAI